MKNISYLLSLLLAFSYVSFADEEVKEAPKESEDIAEESVDEEAEEDKEPTIGEFIEEGEFEVIEGDPRRITLLKIDGIHSVNKLK